MPAPSPVDRGFTRITEGLVHYRHMPGTEEGLPLYMIHLSPSSSRNLEPLMTDLRKSGFNRTMIAPDTLGNGDSAPPTPDTPDIAYFADAAVRTMDSLGLDKVDLLGTHTGARTATEIAAAHPDRVNRIVTDGIREYSPEEAAGFDERYAPKKTYDDYGTQLMWCFHFMRDQFISYPYFQRDGAHRLMRDVPDAETLHFSALDLAKSLTTYHKSYMAAFGYRTSARMALVKSPILLLKPSHAAALINSWADKLAGIAANGRSVEVHDDEAYVREIVDFLKA